MKVSPLTLAIWSAYGTMRATPAAAWRLMRVKRHRDGREGWAAVLPDVWGVWRG